MTAEKIKAMLDVALLAPTATVAEIEKLAQTLIEQKYSYYCVHSLHTKRSAAVLKGSGIKVVSCIGFPHGTITTAAKVFQAQQCVDDGAGEIDMVIELGAVMAGDYKAAEADIKAIVKTAGKLPVKVIIETPYLNAEQKVNVSKAIQNAGAAFVKTCTGCSPDPVALFEDVRLIRQTIGPKMGIKASGRVGNYFRFTSMVEAGATRVGLVLAQAQEILKGYEQTKK
jgi:deoxyribose-phosphate aldolase